MLQLRPTFSESWYRVAGLKAKLRSSAQITRTYFRGERWYVMRDPAGNQYHRLSDAAYRFVGLLDGTRTVSEAWDLVGGQLADDAPTQPEVIQILSQLYAANLMEADVTPDATVLLRRHKNLQKRQLQGRLMNILFPRIPIWDPDRFLLRWMPMMRLFLSKAGAVLWFIVVIAAIAKIAPMMPELQQAARHSIDPGNWLLLWVTFALIKFWHELGHAFMTRRFGGECHEMGIMFLVFIPTPYVDSSTAWSFPNRWARVSVGAAGMIFELFLASIMAFVWANTNSNATMLGIPINQLAFNAMLVASVTTILFNANPLLRYDGYYMLSDFLEIANLQQKSQEYIMGLIKRHVFRIKVREPLPPTGQRLWLFFYGICSSIYRVIVGITIIMVVAYKVPVLGILMAMGGVFMWMVMPVLKVSKYLMLEPELHRKRGRATLFVLAVAALVVIAVGMIRLPVHYRAEGYTEAQSHEVLHSGVPGFVQEIRVKDGQEVKKGDVILVCRDDELALQIGQLGDTLRAYEARRDQSRKLDPAREESEVVMVEATRKKLDSLLERQGKLTIKSPIDGHVVAPDIHNLKGKFVPQGEEICMVAAMDELLIKVNIDQSEAQLQTLPNVREVEIRLAGAVDRDPLKSEKIELIPAAQGKLAHPSLGMVGGGQLQTSQKDPTRPLIEQFELRVRVANPEGMYHNQSTGKNTQYYPGQRAYLRFTLEQNRPLIWQWKRWILQLIETHSKGKWA